MREMFDTKIGWLGPIPKTWKIDKIKYQLSERVEKNKPIKSKNILSLTAKQGVVPLSEKEGGGNKPKDDFTQYRLAYPGDIVMNSMNILSGSVGLSKYFGCVSPVYYMLRNIDNQADIRFYNYIFQTTVFQKSLFGLGNGILIKESGNGKLNTIRMRIPMEKFGRLLIPVAPYYEQKIISDFLDEKCSEIDGLIKDIESQINTLEEYKKSSISEAVTKGTSSNSSILNPVVYYMAPYNNQWKLSKIGYECTKLSRLLDRSSPALICTNKGKVSLRPTEMSGKMVSEDNAMQGIQKGDIAIHGMDTWHGAIALSNYSGKITRVVHVCDSVQDKRFIVYYLRSLAFNGVYKLISNGVRGNTSDFRSWNKVANIYISYPSMEEQKLICDYLDELEKNIDGLISEKNKQIELILEYKKSLIYEYVTGKKEVPANE